MRDFKEILYEAVLYGFGKVLSKHDTFVQKTIMKDVGENILKYFKEEGCEIEENRGINNDINNVIKLFVEKGFAEEILIYPSDKGSNYHWKNLYGFQAYYKFKTETENPFLSCPLNAALLYIAGKYNKTLKLHSKYFDIENRNAVSQEEIIDKENQTNEESNPLVLENTRLHKIIEDREQSLEKALQEIKTLKAIFPKGHLWICRSCKSIRNDKSNWMQIDSYINDYSETRLIYTQCQSCKES